MNNKGQVLITFILIIPLLLLLCAYVIDSAYIAYHSNKLNQLNYLVLSDASKMELSIDEIEDYIKKNDEDVEIILLVKTSNKIEIKLQKNIKSLFGSIVGKTSYQIISNKDINVTDNKGYQ